MLSQCNNARLLSGSVSARLTPSLHAQSKQEGPNGDWVDAIDFSAMDAFVNHVLEVAQKEGYIIAKIFPPNTDVLVQFNEKIMTDIVSWG